MEIWNDLLWVTKSLSLTNNKKEIGIFRFFNQFSKIWRKDNKYRVERIEDRAESCPTPMLILKEGELRLFQK